MTAWQFFRRTITSEQKHAAFLCAFAVTLRARVWVEIMSACLRMTRVDPVTLRARVWVEIVVVFLLATLVVVTLRARVWVEITVPWSATKKQRRHPPCEGVG